MGRMASGEGEGARRDGHADERVEAAGQAADDGAGHEGEELPVGGAHPQAPGSDLAGGDGPKRPADPVLESPVDEQDDDDRDHPDEVVLAQVGVEVEAEDAEGGDGGQSRASNP